MKLCTCPEEGYSQFFGTVSGVCVYTCEQKIAETLAFISLATWVCASIPQYWSNYTHKHVDAIAPLLFIIRGLGDVFMLFGTVLEGASIPIQAISAFFIFDDIVMLGQLYYYTYIYKSKLPSTVTQPQAGGPKKTVTMMALTLISTGALAANMMMTSTSIQSRTLLGVPNVTYCNDFGRTKVEKEIGTVLIWIGGCIYFISRIPQVYKNWRNKRCDGLSIGMFSMFAIANLTYGAYIILTALEEKMKLPDFMCKKFNFLVGSCGVFLFDIIIIIQSKLYSK